MTPRAGSDILFNADDPVGTPPSIGFDPDTAPEPRLAPLPAGPFDAPAAATPFVGWAAPTALTRDFLRVAITDLERLTTGLKRDAGHAQADPRRRVSVARNTADPVFLPTADHVATAAMASFAATNAAVSMIAPELDRDWGPQTPATLGTDSPFAEAFDDPAFTAHPLKGAGAAAGATVSDQSIVIRFDGTLPPGAWVRVWPHDRDTTTGRRKPTTGGAGLSDASGSALVVVALPNGTNGDGTDAVQFSFDMALTTTADHRFYADRRAPRPPVDAAGGALTVTGLGGTQSLYCPETASNPAPSTSAIAPGHSLIVVTGPVTDEDFTAFDRKSLRAEDLSAALPNRADGDDRIITHSPAFSQTKPGDLTTAAAAGGPSRVHDGDVFKASLGQEITDFALHDATANSGLIGAISPRTGDHEAPPAALGHPGVSAASEIHGEGIAIAGPAADALRARMAERRASDLSEFIAGLGTPAAATASPGTPGPWTALLETAKEGTHGHALMSLIPAAVTPGLAWDNADPASPGIKQRIDAVLSGLPGGLTVDGLVDSATFDDSTAAATFDRVLDKHRNGARGFATAASAAIARAEDLIWLQTPALDGETHSRATGDVELLKNITDRLAANPALHVVVVVPAKYLPKRDKKLDAVRKSAIGGALKTLSSAAPTRVAWVAPSAGPGRNFHMASTTLIVDDVVMYSGSAHAWRRGLVFDSGLTAAVFDDRLVDGRPQVVRQARATLAGALLGIGAGFVPRTPQGLVAALQAQSAGGGFGRANPSAFSLKDDATTATDKAIWNPAPDTASQLTNLVAGLIEDPFTSGRP